MNASKCVGAVLVALLVVVLAGGAGEGPMTVTVSEIHLCCPGCVKAIEKAVAEVEGVKATVSQDDGTAVLTAARPEEVQKALDEVAKAGFSGKIEDEAAAKLVAFQPIRTPDGKVAKLEVSHIHNCCRGCSDVIKEALEGIEGVTSNTVEPKKAEFVVEGDFVAADVVQSLLDSGFYVEVK
jgi:copper chaperone CopZ